MTQPPRPVPLHVPVLTEVIELLDVPASTDDANPAGGAQVEDVLSLPLAQPQPQARGPAPFQPVLSNQPSAIEQTHQMDQSNPSALAASAPLLTDALDVPSVPISWVAPAPAHPRPTASPAPTVPTSQVAALSTPAGTSTTTATALPLAGASLSPLTQGAGLPDEAQIAQRVLADVQRQIDGMLEYRLREALTPILARSSEALVRELRQELSKTMRDVVARSVAQEVARHKSKP